MASQGEDMSMRWELLVADTWTDPELRKRLIQDPAAVLKERGIPTPAGVKFKVIEDTADVEHLVLPAKPAAGELSEEQLETVAGGHCHGCGGCSGCRGCGGCGGCRGCGGCGGCRPPCSGCRPSCRGCAM